MEQRHIELIGHRGAPREFEENTLASFARAFERGANAIELDAHGTADGVVVVHHDPRLTTRVEPATLRGRAITEMAWAEVRNVRFGADDTGMVPRLVDVLGTVPAEATAYVEIKGVGIEELVAQVIADSHCRCAVHSFDHGTIERIRSIAPAIPRGLLFDQYPHDLAGAMHRAGASHVWIEHRLFDVALVTEARSIGARTYAWTVNDVEEARRLVQLGVDALCSDDLRRMAFLR